MQLDILTDHADAILLTALGVLLTHWREQHVRRREDRAAAAAALEAQADAFVTAVAAVQVVAAATETLWGKPQEKVRAAAVVGLGWIGGWARSDAGGRSAWPIAAGLADAAHLLSREAHAQKLAHAALNGPMLQVAAAATPLLHHPDERLSQAVEDVMTAVKRRDDAGLEGELRVFHAARVAVAAPPSRWWSRWRRSGQ